MSELSHQELRELLGFYVTGHASDTEKAAVEAHLDGCADCRAELASLRPIVTKLDLVDVNRLDETPFPAPGLMEAVVRRVQEAPPVRAATGRPRGVLMIAAAVVILALGAGVGWLVKPDPAGPPMEAVAIQVDAPSLDAEAVLIAHTWGVEVQLTATGFDPGRAYHVDMVSTTGQRSSAGEFVGTGANPMRCNLNSAVLRPDAAGFEVVDDTGAVVLTSTF